jgi:glucokinase
MINDFGAVAWAVPALGSDEVVTLHGADDAPLRGRSACSVPGTGLGVALLVGGATRGWQVVETEGGHVGFAPLGDEEQAIARWMTAKFGRVSTERLLCGAGLSHIDAALAAGDDLALSGARSRRALRDPAALVEAALDGHDLPRAARWRASARCSAAWPATLR